MRIYFCIIKYFSQTWFLMGIISCFIKRIYQFMSLFFHCWTFKLFPFFQYYKWLCSKRPVLGHPTLLLILTLSLPVWWASRHCHFSSWNILSLTLSYRNHFMVPSEEVGLLPWASARLPNFWLALSKLHNVFPHTWTKCFLQLSIHSTRTLAQLQKDFSLHLVYIDWL